MPEHVDAERAIAWARQVARHRQQRGDIRELTRADLQLILDALDLARAQVLVAGRALRVAGNAALAAQLGAPDE